MGIVTESLSSRMSESQIRHYKQKEQETHFQGPTEVFHAGKWPGNMAKQKDHSLGVIDL